MTTTSEPRRRWFLYSLRALVVLMLLACIGRGWIAVKLRPVKPDVAVGPLEMSDARAREFGAWLEDRGSEQEESLAKLVGMLTPNQLERLRQIQLQYTLATALADPGYIEALDISQEQLDIIRPLSDHIIEMRMAELRALDRLPGEQRRMRLSEITKQRDRAQAEANKVALSVLTPQQRAKLQEFIGEEIEVTWDYDAFAPAVLFP